MAKASACPEVSVLEKLASGLLPAPELETLAGHIETCAQCLAKVQTIAPTDTVAQALSRASEQPDGPDAQVITGLIAKLKKLPAAAGGTISFTCAECGKSLKTKAELAGEKVKCPGCGQAVKVPDTAPVTPHSDDRTLPPRDAGKSVRSVPAACLMTSDMTAAGVPAESEELWDFLAPAQGPDEIGRLGAYRVLEVLGHGGMGVVFRAEGLSLKRTVALKAMLPALAASPSAKKRFLREAQTAASIVAGGVHNRDNHIGYCKGRDGAALRLEFEGVKDIADISPVRAVPIEIFYGGGEFAHDLTPLKGLPLKSLGFNGRVRDLAPLRGMPLKELHIEGPVTDLTPLAGMPLESVRFGFHDSPLADLSPLRGAPLTMVSLYRTAVSDVSPLAAAPLTHLNVARTRVADLRPLAGKNLTHLNFSGANVTDISPLKGMPLELLSINVAYNDVGWTVRVSDISVLRGLPLKSLSLDIRMYFEPDLQLLKSLPLEKLNGKPVKEFWKEFAAERQAEAKFIQSLAKLPFGEQAKAVQGKLNRPGGLDFNFKHVVRDNSVTEISLALANEPIWPLRAFPKLKKLTLEVAEQVKYIDLSPLIGLPIEELHCGSRVEHNLPVLRAMKSLKTINGKDAKQVLGK